MSSSLPNIVNNLAEVIHKIKCEYRHGNKKCDTDGAKKKNCECCFEYTTFKDDLIE